MCPWSACAIVPNKAGGILAGMGSPKTPKPPPPAPAPAQLVEADEGTGSSNFEEELRRLRKKSSTVKAGETGGYGGNTMLG